MKGPSCGEAGATTEAAQPSLFAEPLKKLPKLVFNLLTVKQLCANVSKVGLPVTRDGRPDSKPVASREVRTLIIPFSMKRFCK
jgi:hypothetical protein